MIAAIKRAWNAFCREASIDAPMIAAPDPEIARLRQIYNPRVRFPMGRRAGVHTMTPEEVRSREYFWRRELNGNLGLYDSLEFKWVPAGVEPSIDDEMAMIKQGWSLGGFKGLRHYARPIKPRVRVKMGRREISMAEYFWRSAQFNAIGIWRRTNEGMPYYAPVP